MKDPFAKGESEEFKRIVTRVWRASTAEFDAQYHMEFLEHLQEWFPSTEEGVSPKHD